MIIINRKVFLQSIKIANLPKIVLQKLTQKNKIMFKILL